MIHNLTFETEGDVTYLASRDGRLLREGDRVRAGEPVVTEGQNRLVDGATVQIVNAEAETES